MTDKLVELAEGVYVNSDVFNIVEQIRAYDPRLKVKFCDPNRATFRDAPYILVEECPDGFERIVFEIWNLDQRVLDRIRQADTLRTDVLASIDKANEGAKKEQKRRYREMMDEAEDIVAHAYAYPKSDYSFTDVNGEKHWIRDYRKG